MGKFVLACALAVVMVLLFDSTANRTAVDWGAIGFYATCALLLYGLKAVPDINQAIKSG